LIALYARSHMTTRYWDLRAVGTVAGKVEWGRPACCFRGLLSM